MSRGGKGRKRFCELEEVGKELAVCGGAGPLHPGLAKLRMNLREAQVSLGSAGVPLNPAGHPYNLCCVCSPHVDPSSAKILSDAEHSWPDRELGRYILHSC